MELGRRRLPVQPQSRYDFTWISHHQSYNVSHLYAQYLKLIISHLSVATALALNSTSGGWGDLCLYHFELTGWLICFTLFDQQNPPKMVTRQSILRSSMPVFSASAAKQASKLAPETVTALKSGHKNGSKSDTGDADLAALLAEVRVLRPSSVSYEFLSSSSHCLVFLHPKCSDNSASDPQCLILNLSLCSTTGSVDQSQNMSLEFILSKISER